MPEFEAAIDDDVADDLLPPRIHILPSSSPFWRARVALTLRLLGGLTSKRSRGPFLSMSKPLHSALKALGVTGVVHTAAESTLVMESVLGTHSRFRPQWNIPAPRPVNTNEGKSSLVPIGQKQTRKQRD